MIIELKKPIDDFRRCINCGETDDVLEIKLGLNESSITAMPMCKYCRAALAKKLRTGYKTCGNCNWCCKSAGKPYYCVLRDLYYFVDEDKKACSKYLEGGKNDSEL